MNAPLPKEAAPLKPEVQQALDTFIALLGGGEGARRTVHAVYQLGYMDGALDMAKVGQKRLVDAAMRSAL